MRPEDDLESLSLSEIEQTAERLYGLRGAVTALPGYAEANYLVRDPESPSILKAGGVTRNLESWDLQQAVLEYLYQAARSLPCPRLRLSRSGKARETLTAPDGRERFVRVLSYLPGTPWARLGRAASPLLLGQAGSLFGKLDNALEGFRDTRAFSPDLDWNLENTLRCEVWLDCLASDEEVERVARVLRRFRVVSPMLKTLRRGWIHGDGNDHNVLVDPRDDSVVGVIDFGDVHESATICDLAILCAYLLLNTTDPLTAACHVVAGYHRERALTPDECQALFPLIQARLAISVCQSARQRAFGRTDDYFSVSEKAAWESLTQLEAFCPTEAEERFRKTCGFDVDSTRRSTESIRADRERFLNPSLSLSYRRPLHIVSGSGTHLQASSGQSYLDMVNNVCHVGHSHPQVVRALEQQAKKLNTNTRYLHENLTRYAHRIVSLLPEPLSVCYFVCSGSEANDLALRLARAHTGRDGVVVVEGAYHGNLSSLIDISPYKYNGPGGRGRAAHVSEVPMPDSYRGIYRGPSPNLGTRYAEHVKSALEGTGAQPGAFFCESALGVGGQIILPDGYLASAYDWVHSVGGVCVADEVQVGFGRIGSHFWTFETQGVVPDIVTMGKPIGNGHPMAAVVTTPEIADSFNDGMEYFNTFGGNPVSCAVGLAVLDVIEQEGLQAAALRVGTELLKGLKALQRDHALIGDVRGRGLFVGIELVRDRQTLEPARAQAAAIAEELRDRRILISVDGPLHNVLKIKPPLSFSSRDAERFLNEFAEVLDGRDWAAES